ncbi:MAG: hypothetical protein AB8H86_31105 [Polyangiales bacterium]
MLDSIAPGVWSTSTPVRFVGIPMHANTTIATLEDGLFVCSPGAMSDELKRAIDAIGEVRVIAAPNRFHHLFVSEWREAFPDASVHVPQSLVSKRADLADCHFLGEEAHSDYADVIAQQRMHGLPLIDETWFFHRPSKTLINNDLMHNVHEESSALARSAWWMMGAWKNFGPSRMERWLARDKPALRDSVEAALAWKFERALVAHGDVFEPAGDPRSEVRDVWHWLLKN